LTAQNRIPVIYYDRAFVESGGLISYGTSLVDMYRETGRYTGRILNGEEASQLPVEMPERYELTVNVADDRRVRLVREAIPDVAVAGLGQGWPRRDQCDQYDAARVSITDHGQAPKLEFNL
jgi:hypothetical protein